MRPIFWFVFSVYCALLMAAPLHSHEDGSCRGCAPCALCSLSDSQHPDAGKDRLVIAVSVVAAVLPLKPIETSRPGHLFPYPNAPPQY